MQKRKEWPQNLNKRDLKKRNKNVKDWRKSRKGLPRRRLLKRLKD